MTLPTNTIPYIRDRLRRADMLLFTGAGFASLARNRFNANMPLLSQLRQPLWDICFPGKPMPDNASVQTLFSTAAARAGGALRDFLIQYLTCSPEGVPTIYDDYFSYPWSKVYTLNVDNIDAIVAARAGLQRRIRRVSAVRPDAASIREIRRTDLQVVHLNGFAEQGAADVTFSLEQYAERLAVHDPFYVTCAADLAASPALVIGTPLDESPLWQHLQLRKRGVEKRYRKRSFLITPELDPARKEVLERELNIEHIAMTAEEFFEEVLRPLRDDADYGISELVRRETQRELFSHIPLVSELASNELEPARDYLIGSQPHFPDVRVGRTAVRNLAGVLVTEIADALRARLPKVLFVTGTAGSGKTTVLMQAALELDASGVSAGWLNAETEASPSDIMRCLSSSDRPSVLFVDDCFAFGLELPNIMGELAKRGTLPIAVFCCRSSHADRAIDALALNDVHPEEQVLQYLDDQEIRRVISVLDKENLLGELKGLQDHERVRRFVEKAGRQLIVAMIEATSGRPHKEKLVSEMDGLEGEARDVYALVAITTSLGFSISLTELLIAVSGLHERTHRAVETLERRLMIVRTPKHSFRVRHQVIASILRDAMHQDGSAKNLLKGLAYAFAVTVATDGGGRSQERKRLRQIINHDFLFRQGGAQLAGEVYESLEPVLSQESQYWLQRGSYEVEHGSLDLAENYLKQAGSLAPNDNLCKTEMGYLRLKQAVRAPAADAARLLRDEGYNLLSDAIEGRRQLDPHQYHILGKQLLAWTKRGDVTADEREEWLRIAAEHVDEGYAKHKKDERLRELWVEITAERIGAS